MNKANAVPRAAAIYCRISSDRTGEGLGVERQETLCRKLAAERGWTVAEVYVDNDRSAYSRKPRPAYQRVLADIKAGLRDAVLCVRDGRIHQTRCREGVQLGLGGSARRRVRPRPALRRRHDRR